MSKKRCPTCGKTKKLEEFHKCRSRKLGVQATCKACRHQYYLDRQRHFIKGKNDEWLEYFSSVHGNPVKCEVCGKDIYFFSGNQKTSVHFDHRHGEATTIKYPGRFFQGKHATPENIMRVEEEDWGFLCQQCNQRLPTDLHYRKQLQRYIYENS